MLEHLIVVPRGGLCNRIRAIASGRRICAATLARLTVVWEWGDPLELFAPGQGIEWVPELGQAGTGGGYVEIHHRLFRDGGNEGNRRITTGAPRVVVHSQYVFCGEDEALVQEQDLRPFLLEAAVPIRAAATAFVAQEIRGRRVVGLHMRRTDHPTATACAPDDLFRAAAWSAIADGAGVFLATDNAATLAMMRARVAGLVSYPKRAELVSRWPRPEYSATATADDFADLLVLSSCDYVLGSAGSSYSRQAMIRNGSVRCRMLEAPPARGNPARPLWGAGQLTKR